MFFISLCKDTHLFTKKQEYDPKKSDSCQFVIIRVPETIDN